MKAQILKKIVKLEENPEPLEMVDLPIPQPNAKEILVRISACGVCHTEIDEIEGRCQPKLPVIPGHEIVGTVQERGNKATKFQVSDRVGIAWIYASCGKCGFCREGKENLCPEFQATGCDANGGYAQYMVVSEDFAYPIPERFTAAQAAPLLCAGAIGYRALNLTGIQDHQILGLFGFGASAHIVIQLAKYKYPHGRVFVFTRPGQKEHQDLAKKLGADWTGATGDNPPANLNYAIDFTPVWKPVVEALRILEKGGRVVINAIRKEEMDKNSLLELNYSTHLWQEKEIKSVANITRKDVQEFLPLAGQIPIIPEVQEFKLAEANKALNLLKRGRIQGAGVLRVD